MPSRWLRRAIPSSLLSATYTENLTIGFSLRIIGSGATTTMVDGGGAGRVVTIPNTNASVPLKDDHA
jgi:hypothetical protein